jgi:N-acetylneuraminic acid mutarotase
VNRTRPLLFLLAAPIAACSSTSHGTDGTTASLDAATQDAQSSPDSTASSPDAMEGMDVDGGLPLGTAPIGRSDMAFATDPDSKKVYMIDGDKALPVQCNPSPSDFVDDAWVFDPQTMRWAAIDTSMSAMKPLKRARASGAWDKMGKRFIVFGGRYRNGTAGSYTWLNDVWALDPMTGTWTQLSAQGNPAAPSGRMNSAMVSDPGNNAVFIHAGGIVDANGFMFDVTNDTWQFNLSDNSWHAITAPSPPMGRLFHTAAFDPMHHVLYVWGGAGADAFTAASFYNDLWTLDLDANRWTQVPTAASFPDGRIKGVMQFDGPRNRLVLFGGHDSQDVTNSVYTFDLMSKTWTKAIAGDQITGMATGTCMFPGNFATIDPMSPERREGQLFSVVGDSAVAFSGETDCGISNDTWTLDLAMMTWTKINDSFTGLTCPRTHADPNACSQAGAQLCN